ncbi:hypothetical protein AB0J52_07740 [Spirillospora sp. NPDC049652]
MELAKAWGAALAVWIVGSMLTAVVAVAADHDRLADRIRLEFAPTLLLNLLVVVVAGFLYRGESGRGWVVAMAGVPLAAWLLNVVLWTVGGARLSDVGLGTAAQLLGVLLGVLLAGLVRRRTADRSSLY